MQTKQLCILLLVAFQYLAFSQGHDKYEYKIRENRMEGRERRERLFTYGPRMPLIGQITNRYVLYQLGVRSI